MSATANITNNSMKVILVGSSGVGKTSLVSAFFDNPFEVQEQSTVAPASCSAIIDLPNGRKVNTQIWDTAGQERFQSISIMFYRESNVAFVCYDPLQQEDLEKWVGQVRSEAPDCKIFIVATKIDLIPPENIEKVRSDGEEMVRKYNAHAHFMTSSKEGKGVHEVFEEAAKTASEVNKEDVMALALDGGKKKDGGCC